jgi:dihydroxy-acid dehydratase
MIAEDVKQRIREAGGSPVEFDTVSVSDGISMGTPGMKMSLISRDLIADSVELVVRAHSFDEMVLVGGCDKTLPGMAMGLIRLNFPGLVLYSGSIHPE